MRGSIAVVVVCLVLGVTGNAAAQEAQEAPADDGAPGSVEMSLSIAPVGILSLLALNLGGGGGTPGLGALGALRPTLDVGFAINRSLLFVVGFAASVSSYTGMDGVSVGVPLSLLWYLEPPRVGHVMPMLRVGVDLAYDHYSASSEYESFFLGALARGGITWLADRCIGLRAELGLRGGVRVDDLQDSLAGTLGLDALVGVVLRV